MDVRKVKQLKIVKSLLQNRIKKSIIIMLFSKVQYASKHNVSYY